MTVDEIAKELTHKYGFGWDIYRGAGGDFLVHVKPQGFDDANFGAGTITEAMRLANEHKPVAQFHRRPKLYTYTVEKVKDGEWRVVGSDGSRSHYATKRRALEVCELAKQRDLREQEEWDSTCGLIVAEGVEGEDYRYLR